MEASSHKVAAKAPPTLLGGARAGQKKRLDQLWMCPNFVQIVGLLWQLDVNWAPGLPMDYESQKAPRHLPESNAESQQHCPSGAVVRISALPPLHL